MAWSCLSWSELLRAELFGILWNGLELIELVELLGVAWSCLELLGGLLGGCLRIEGQRGVTPRGSLENGQSVRREVGNLQSLLI